MATLINSELVKRKQELIRMLEQPATPAAKARFQEQLAKVEDKLRSQLPKQAAPAVVQKPAAKEENRTEMRKEYRVLCTRYKNLIDEVAEVRARKKFLRETLELVKVRR